MAVSPVAEVHHVVDLGADEAFARLTDWSRHQVPFTDIETTADGFVARTGFGPVRLADPMIATIDPDARTARLDKTGAMLRGWAEITVTDLGCGSEVCWREHIKPRWAPALVATPVQRATEAMIRHILRGLF